MEMLRGFLKRRMNQGCRCKLKRRYYKHFKKTKKRIDYSGSMADYADSMAVIAHSQSGVSNSRATSIKSQGLFLHFYNPR
jgi:hypothetical protein